MSHPSVILEDKKRVKRVPCSDRVSGGFARRKPEQKPLPVSAARLVRGVSMGNTSRSLDQS